MSEYRAKPGMEDRDGEMTGAITFNMTLCMPPITVWSIFIGPWLFDSVWPTALIALAMAVIMPLACMPLSRKIWAMFSDWADHVEPTTPPASPQGEQPHES